ncbi:MAG TPA: hypothetical protein PLX89_20645, partial [Verrucomicrobiota bacterium]|nr:hypothetical protein [Verrucomicrobiota bacterium]
RNARGGRAPHFLLHGYGSAIRIFMRPDKRGISARVYRPVQLVTISLNTNHLLVYDDYTPNVQTFGG